jgi:hypothetical protein
MNVKFQLHNSSQPIEYIKVKASYEKGSFYCVYLESGEVHKFPINDIFRIVEDYGYHSQRTEELTKNKKD